MRQKATMLALGMLASTAAWAQKADGLTVRIGDEEQQFPISMVKEITFSDEGMTVVKTDNATVEFSSGWQMRFGEIETTGISLAAGTAGNAKAQVYDAGGNLLMETKMADLRISELPKGVYMIMCNGKSLKITR